MPFPSPIETSNAAEARASSVFWREVKFQLASSFALDLRKDYFSLFFSFHFSIGINSLWFANPDGPAAYVR